MTSHQNPQVAPQNPQVAHQNPRAPQSNPGFQYIIKGTGKTFEHLAGFLADPHPDHECPSHKHCPNKLASNILCSLMKDSTISHTDLNEDVARATALHIGMTDLALGTGVYFSISPTRCFAAHIDLAPGVSFRPHEIYEDEKPEIPGRYYPLRKDLGAALDLTDRPECRESVTRVVTKWLDAEKERQGWEAIQPSTWNTVIIASPMCVVPGRIMLGNVIARAIYDWLDVPINMRVISTRHHFIAEHSNRLKSGRWFYRMEKDLFDDGWKEEEANGLEGWRSKEDLVGLQQFTRQDFPDWAKTVEEPEKKSRLKFWRK